MAINKKLIHFNKKESFEEQLANNNLLDTSIVFIKDSKEIWTHGQLYNCSSKDITSTDIIDALGYTPLSTAGGTISAVGSHNGILNINDDNETGWGIIRLLRQNVAMSAIGADTHNGGFWVQNIQEGSNYKIFAIKEDGLYYGGDTLIHSGNIGSYNAGGLAHSNGTVGATVESNGRVHFNRAIVLANEYSLAVTLADGATVKNAVLMEDTDILNIGKGVAQSGCQVNLNGNVLGFCTSTSLNTAMLINSSGNVTIGASDLAGTSAKLYVDGNIMLKSTSKIGAEYGDTKATYNYIEFNAAENGLRYFSGAWASSTAKIAHQFIVHSSLNAAMTIYNSGNVLIGTTTDNGAKLQVEGFASFKNEIDVWEGDTKNRLTIYEYQGIGRIYSYNETDKTFGDLWIGNNRGDILKVKANGNVGIGTTGPAYKLDVAGTIRATYITSPCLSINRDAEKGNIIDSLYAGLTAECFADNIRFRVYKKDGTASNAMILHDTGAVTMSSTLDVTSHITTSNRVYASYVFLAKNAEGIYLGNDGICWHNNSNTWASTLFTFASNGITAHVPVTMSSTLSVGGNVLIGTTTDSGEKLQVIGSASFGSATSWQNERVVLNCAGLKLYARDTGGYNQSISFYNYDGTVFAGLFAFGRRSLVVGTAQDEPWVTFAPNGVDIKGDLTVSGNIIGNASSASSVPWEGVTDKPTFAAVATSGSYNDLSDKPTIENTWRDITDSVTLTSSTVSASASAVRLAYGKAVDAYNLADSKGEGTVTSITVKGSNGLTGSGTVTATGTVTISGVDASTSAIGVVKLSSAINSTSETLAATPKAVKTAYDLANGKWTYVAASTTANGAVTTGTQSFEGLKTFAKNVTAPGFFQSSDERLKDFGEDITIDFDVLKSIPKKYFTWKNDLEKKLNIGTGAQTVQKYYPELVNDNNGTLTVAYDKMSMLALKAVDILYEENVNLKNECSELKNECSELKYRLDKLENFLNGVIYGN